MPDMPSLGESTRGRSAAAVGAIVMLVGGLGAGGWVAHQRRGAAAVPIAPSAPPLAAPAEPGPAAALAPSPGDAPSLAAAAPLAPVHHGGLQSVSVVINGPLEKALVTRLGREVAQPLTQVVVRSLVWWMSVPADLRKGDTLDVLFEEREGQEPLVHAVRYKSDKLQQSFRAYRYKSAESKFARYYQADGQELEMRLEDGPLDDYEQVTSLIRDGRGHKGVDFRTPVGTAVKAPFDGVIARCNWNLRANGNSVELRESGAGARTAAFLHLSPLPSGTQAGAKFTRGQVIAQTGNTGHSFAPHLHYQMSDATHPVLDPFETHQTARRKLPASEKSVFDTEVRRLDGALASTRPGT